MPSPTLYQRILEADFDRLPAVLRDFHSLPEGGRAHGILTVERGSGALRRVLARSLGLPEPGRDVPVHVEVVVRDGREIWIRRFGASVLRTVQAHRRGRMIERAGPCQIVFALAVTDSGLRFCSERTLLFGIPLPAAFSLRVDASTDSMGDRWKLAVDIAAPGLGMLTRYWGVIAPTP
jgi:hypothetical protein